MFKNAIKRWLGIQCVNLNQDTFNGSLWEQRKRIADIEGLLSVISFKEPLTEERLQDIEKDIKLTWEYLGVTKSMIPAKDRSYKLTKNK